MSKEIHPEPRTDEEVAARRLEATGGYHILRKLQPSPVVENPRLGFPLTGLIVDTETTGLNNRTHEIIEIGAVAFTFDSTGKIGDVTNTFCGLQQPKLPIPAEITRLTGIDDELVQEQQIDVARLEALIEPADLIIAHNAGFDRPFCEALSPLFNRKAWACSLAEIDWRSRGCESRKLGDLLARAGHFHAGHRALDDCFALLEVLAGSESENAPFSELYLSSQQSMVRLYAENSPFSMKDHLKARGYRWSDGTGGRPKSWWIELPEEALDHELRYLRAEIYRSDLAAPVAERLTALNRYKSR